MWLRHFAHKRSRPRFRSFRKRYYSFDRHDVVEICNWHHEEIHVIYLEIINARLWESGKPFKQWSWPEADALMNELRFVCNSWILTPTPGLQPVKFRPTTPL